MVVWLLMPAVVLHELTHAVIADRWADVEIDWSEPAVWMIWPSETPPLGYLSAFLSPMVIGYAVGLLAVGACVIDVFPSLPLWASIWLGGNWLYYSFPTRSDLSSISDLQRSY